MPKINKIAGVDEVGRGCLAGPVFAAAVILNSNIDTKDIKDSKKISFHKRISISNYIKKNSIYAIGTASVEEINKINILNASLLSMKRAVEKLNPKPGIAYIDGLFAPKKLKIKCKTFVRGDEKIISIAAASIIAKQVRDESMKKISAISPAFHVQSNKGYGSKQHLNGIGTFGISVLHRKSFTMRFQTNTSFPEKECEKQRTIF